MLKTEVEDAEEIPRLNLPKTPDILIDTTNSLTLTDICNSLPPRHVADELISLYFNSKHKQARTCVSLSFKRPADLCSNYSHSEVFKGGMSITSQHLTKQLIEPSLNLFGQILRLSRFYGYQYCFRSCTPHDELSNFLARSWRAPRVQSTSP